MREIAVYYCGKCGRYGYYSLVRNAICPSCNRKLAHLDLPYLEFIKLDPEDREDLITRDILEKDPLITNRILASARLNNTRNRAQAVMTEMKEYVQELELENAKLNETIEWMHQTIWNLLRRTKSLEHRLEGLELHQD